MDSERGQTTIEWTGLILLVALGLGALLAFGPRIDGRPFGGFLAHSIVCAVRGNCEERDGVDELVTAYGEDDAELVRRFAPNIVYEPRTRTLPVDFRTCRAHRCSDAPDDRELDVHRTNRGRRATVFTHIVRSEGETFLQYWFYYPDSTSTYRGVVPVWNATVGRVATYPGYHADDWESYQVRIGRDGRAMVRASSHHDYQGCKEKACRNEWVPWTGWTRVSWGSHAGHIPLKFKVDRIRGELDNGIPHVYFDGHREPQYPGVHLRERTSTAAGLKLVPIETLDTDAYVPLDPRHKPPWEKKVYYDPRTNTTG